MASETTTGDVGEDEEEKEKDQQQWQAAEGSIATRFVPTPTAAEAIDAVVYLREATPVRRPSSEQLAGPIEPNASAAAPNANISHSRVGRGSHRPPLHVPALRPSTADGALARYLESENDPNATAVASTTSTATAAVSAVALAEDASAGYHVPGARIEDERAWDRKMTPRSSSARVCPLLRNSPAPPLRSPRFSRELMGAVTQHASAPSIEELERKLEEEPPPPAQAAAGFNKIIIPAPAPESRSESPALSLVAPPSSPQTES